MTVGECQERMTLREYAAWIHRINKENEEEREHILEPRLTEWYLIQLAFEVRLLRNVQCGITEVPPWDEFILKDKEEEKKKDRDIKKKTQSAQDAWIARASQTGLQVQVPDFEKWQQQSTK